MSYPARPIEERFWEKVDKDGPVPQHRPELGPCWIWTCSKNGKGYGRFMVTKGHFISAHRFVFGEVIVQLQVDHLCRNHSCVNRSHLELVTKQENQRRGLKGDFTTHCPQGHAYDEGNTYTSKRGHRHCRTCHRERECIRRAA